MLLRQLANIKMEKTTSKCIKKNFYNILCHDIHTHIRKY